MDKKHEKLIPERNFKLSPKAMECVDETIEKIHILRYYHQIYGTGVFEDERVLGPFSPKPDVPSGPQKEINAWILNTTFPTLVANIAYDEYKKCLGDQAIFLPRKHGEGNNVYPR